MQLVVSEVLPATNLALITTNMTLINKKLFDLHLAEIPVSFIAPVWEKSHLCPSYWFVKFGDLV